MTTAANIFFEPTLTYAAKLLNARLTACFGSIEQPHNHIAVPEDQHENRYDNDKHAFGYGLIRDRDIAISGKRLLWMVMASSGLAQVIYVTPSYRRMSRPNVGLSRRQSAAKGRYGPICKIDQQRIGCTIKGHNDR